MKRTLFAPSMKSNPMFWAALIAAALTFGSTVRAQETGAAAPEEAKKPLMVYKSSEQHNFSGIKLKGQMKKPEISYIYRRKGIRSEKIISVPEDFNSDIIQTAGKF